MDWNGIDSETILAVIGSLVTGAFGFLGAILTLRSQAARAAATAADSLRDDMMGWVDHQAIEIRQVRLEIDAERRRAKEDREQARKETAECLQREAKLREQVELADEAMLALKARVYELESKPRHDR